MNKQVEEIKAEIERLYKEAKEEPYTLRAEGKLEAFDKLDAFIDSLEEDDPLDKVCEWLENEFTYPSMTDIELRFVKNKINKLRKAMEDDKK